MSRVQGFVEEGPHYVEGKLHWWVSFPSVGDGRPEVSFVSIPQTILESAGVEFSEHFDEGQRPIVEADVNDCATTREEVNPLGLQFVGCLPGLDEKIV